jgi:hypothetical protein
MRYMLNISEVLTHLEEERSRLTSELDALGRALSVLNGSRSNGAARPSKMSQEARAKIAAAQRARWAKVKGKKVVSIAAARKPKMSAAGLANIRAAQKARWAQWKRQHKKRA